MDKNLEYYQLSINQTLDNLKTTTDGLSQKEASQRLAIYGKNTLKEIHKTSKIIKFLAQFKDILIILLIVSMIISIYLEDVRWATILWIIIIINAIIGYIQEAKAAKIMESLKNILHPTAKVKRNGKLIEESAENLVPGDIIYMEAGENIAADVRIFEESEFQTNDFSLTGESNPVHKFTHAIPGDVPLWERNNSGFMGTSIATGYARGIVVATGMDTELGKIANLSEAQEFQETPLQKEMKNIAKKLTIGTLVLSWILIIISLFANFTLREAFIFAIGIAAAMVPQGLPAQVSIALSLAAGRLAKKQALIKQLWSVETLWCVNIICTDKTGTLTKNEMTVKKICIGNTSYDIPWTGYEPIISKELEQLSHQRKHFFYAGFLASNAKINPPDKEHNNWYCIGDPTEWALVNLWKKCWFDTEKLFTSYKQYHQFWFDSIRKMMSSVRNIDGKTTIYVKWAPNEILERCTQIFDGKKVRKITEEDKKTIGNAIENFSKQAMRNIAFAYKEIDEYTKDLKMDDAESKLIFTGFVAIIDPPREEVPFAIKSARDAKIKIIMITWDAGTTAEAIADQIGLDGDGKMTLIEWNDLKEMSDIKLISTIERYRSLIFSRTAPEDKLRIVNLLKKRQYIVAVTGDGINDAPALKSANIGVAMGNIGTDVAKESSEIILLDDNFHTLVWAIKEGRIIYQNLKKTIISSITSNWGELFVILTSLVGQALFNVPIAINAVQILAIDLIGEMWPLTALTRDPAQKNLMKQWPRKTKEHIINTYTIIDLLWSGALMGWIWYLAYIVYLHINHISAKGLDITSGTYMTATTVTYTSIIFCQYANIISRRAGVNDHIFSKYMRANKKLLFSFAWGILIILFLIYNPVVNKYFWFNNMRLVDRLFPIIGGITFLTIRESYKFIMNKYKSNKKKTPSK